MSRQDRVGEKLQALALLGACHGDDRVAGIFIGLVIARDRLAADILRREGRAVAPLLEQDRECAAGPRPRFAVLDHAGIQVFEQLGCQRDPILAELARVGAQVPAIDVGVIVQERIFVGRVDQVVLGRPRRRSS